MLQFVSGCQFHDGEYRLLLHPVLLQTGTHFCPELTLALRCWRPSVFVARVFDFRSAEEGNACEPGPRRRHTRGTHYHTLLPWLRSNARTSFIHRRTAREGKRRARDQNMWSWFKSDEVINIPTRALNIGTNIKHFFRSMIRVIWIKVRFACWPVSPQWHSDRTRSKRLRGS